MYSIVMMAALATNGPDAVEWGRRGGGCYGCSGCMGCNGCSGCWGGCWGGGRWGGCHGYGCNGCYGQVAYGQYGGDNYHGYCSCFGQYGGTACYGGCYGSCMGCTGHYAGCYGGCYGQPIWYGPSQPYHPADNPMAAPPPQNKPADAPKEGQAPAKPMGGAKVIFDMPEGANLFVEEQPIKGTAASRSYTTPSLVPGQTYFYTVRVETVRDGKPLSETRQSSSGLATWFVNRSWMPRLRTQLPACRNSYFELRVLIGRSDENLTGLFLSTRRSIDGIDRFLRSRLDGHIEVSWTSFSGSTRLGLQIPFDRVPKPTMRPVIHPCL